MRTLIGLALAAALGLPTAASASTVTVGPAREGTDPYGRSESVQYAAAPGEANLVTVSFEADGQGITVTDPGAPVDPHGSCTAIDLHSARCTRSPGRLDRLIVADADLGDLDDEIRVDTSQFGMLAANGGPGDDRLQGGIASDQLTGGDGRDVLLGGDGYDVLSEGDPVGAAPDADVFDGGADSDQVSYASRTAAVTVDLAAGSAADGDTFAGVENLTGGAGPDRLSGDEQSNVLIGGDGDDVLVGRGSPEGSSDFDSLEGGGGADSLDGGAGLDLLDGNEGLDRIACGSGFDRVTNPEPGELLNRLCELGDATFGINGSGQFTFRPTPLRTRPRTVVFVHGCPIPDVDGEFVPCTMKVRIRETTGRRRLLGRGRYTIKSPELDERPPVRLTKVGRRLTRRKAGVLATVFVTSDRFEGAGPIAWTILLKSRFSAAGARRPR
jgi:hypothetical protein